MKWPWCAAPLLSVLIVALVSCGSVSAQQAVLTTTLSPKFCFEKARPGAAPLRLRPRFFHFAFGGELPVNSISIPSGDTTVPACADFG
jgi:hypothetical protein